MFTDFLTEVNRIKRVSFSNEKQIQTVIAARKHMELHFAQDLGLDALASEHCVSKYHLIRLFKRYYGQTPNQFLMQIRIKKAKEFLGAGMSVTDTCFQVGFKSLGSFSSLFTLKVGISPSQYRKRQFSRRL